MTPFPAGSSGQLGAPGAIAAAAEQVAAEFASRAQEADREARFPPGDLAALRASGLLGVMVPTRLGGPGASFGDYARLAMTLARGSGSSALVFNMHASVTGALAQTPDGLVRSLGAPEGYFALRDALLLSARDGAFFAVAMSERGAGSRLSALSTTYSRTGSGFVIRGSKAFVSGAALADGYLVAARSEADSGRVSYFLVNAGDGVVVEPTWDVLGMRGTGSDDILLDVEVAEDALLGGVEGLGLLIARLMPHWLVASYAAVYVGVARACIDAAVVHVRERSLDRLSAVRARIGQADAAVASAELLVLEAAARVDADPGTMETNRAVYRAKLVAGQTAQDVAASMLEAAGASATRRGHPLERLYRDARCGSLQPATSDVCADWLGMFALGLDPNAAEVPAVVSPQATITAIASSFPATLSQDDLWREFFEDHYGARRAARQAYFSTGVARRHAAVAPTDEDLSRASTAVRMQRYLAEAMPLGKAALTSVLERAELGADDLGLLAVVSCTGYATPGIDVRLARDLSMTPELRRLVVGHVGCHAALPTIDVVRHYVVAEQRPAVVLCLELPSLHVQAPSLELEDVVIHALFSDAASAVVIQPGSPARGGLAVIDAASLTDTAFAEEMTWTITDFGFKMTLSRHVPDVLAGLVEPLVDGLLARNGLERGDVAGWAVHPGGPRVLDVIAARLGLSAGDLNASRQVLVNHGNCSSATVLVVLEEIARTTQRQAGDFVVALAFGPGLTLCATLFRQV